MKMGDTTFTASAWRVLIVCIVFAILSLFAVSLRLISKFYFLKSARREEVVGILAVFCTFGMIYVVWGEATHGLGEHIADLPKDKLKRFLKYFWVSILLYCFGITLAKISICIGYLRVFTTGHARNASRAGMALTVLFGVQLILTNIISCIPVSSFWDVDIQGKCIPKAPLFMFQAAFNIFLDMFLLAIPLPVLWGLYMPLKQKMLLSVVFMLGGFVVLVSILRLTSLHAVAVSNDVSFDNANAFMWSAIEVNVAIICAALQSARPVIAYIFPRVFASLTTNSRTRTRGQHYELSNTTGTHNTFKRNTIHAVPNSGLFSKVSAGAPIKSYRSSHGGSQDTIVRSEDEMRKDLGAIMVTREIQMERHVEHDMDHEDRSRRNDPGSFV
ncbi:hypothetical protein HYFRA_00003069 [Hymenoscyphus fraxineus]|uniref:Rhodopsin domain-containing protein n=1 Tax=Hymenoscyphus fraxineus TaxID=746836 RepID=A0A9N9KRS3_9HELO|nr:hypothetical protein HYFRA_00003069 [Hymenoscyphus fraxineus]